MWMHVSPVTVEELARAMIDRTGCSTEAASESAEAILDMFGFDLEIIDNVLEPRERQLMYSLQRAGLFTTRSEVTTLPTGHDWRTHYWILREGEVRAASAAREVAEQALEAIAESSPYEQLPDEAWARG